MTLPDVLHIIPRGDLREHELKADCWCEPTQDEEDLNLYVHNALDQRELYETGQRRLN